MAPVLAHAALVSLHDSALVFKGLAQNRRARGGRVQQASMVNGMKMNIQNMRDKTVYGQQSSIAQAERNHPNECSRTLERVIRGHAMVTPDKNCRIRMDEKVEVSEISRIAQNRIGAEGWLRKTQS